MTIFRSSRPEVFLEKAGPKICSKFTPMLKWDFNNFKNKNFRILKTLIIFLFCLCELFFNQSGKVLKETLASSRFCKNNIGKICLCYFKINLSSSFASSSNFSSIFCHLLHTIESIANGSVDYGAILNWQVDRPGHLARFSDSVC